MASNVLTRVSRSRCSNAANCEILLWGTGCACRVPANTWNVGCLRMKEMRMHEILVTARQTFIPMPSTRIHQHLPITPSYIEANYARYTTSSSCSSCQLRSQQIQPRSVNSNSDSDAFKEEPKLGTVCRAKISLASRVNVGLDPEDPNVVLCRSHLMMKRMTYIVGHNLYNHYMIIYNIARMIEESFCS